MVPLSMTLSDLWPRFQGHDIFWSQISLKKRRVLKTKLLLHNMKLYLAYGMLLFGDLDWPLNASLGLSASAELLVFFSACFSHFLFWLLTSVIILYTEYFNGYFSGESVSWLTFFIILLPLFLTLLLHWTCFINFSCSLCTYSTGLLMSFVSLQFRQYPSSYDNQTNRHDVVSASVIIWQST